MKPITVSKTIAADPARVFEIMSDFEHAPERISAITKVEMHTEGPTRLGTRFTEWRTMFGKEASETMEVSAFEPGRSYTLAAESHGSRYTTTMRALPDNGGTRVECEFSAEPQTAIAKVMGVVMGPMLRNMCCKAFDQDFEDLRTVAEAGDAAEA